MLARANPDGTGIRSQAGPVRRYERSHGEHGRTHEHKKTQAMNEIELLMEYAKAWNNLDTSYIKDLLHEDFEYTSQWVFETMHGRDTYMEYLGAKFRTIREELSIPEAEIAYYRYAYMHKDKPCLVLTQGDRKVSIIVQVANGRITRADMIGIPSPDVAISFGIQPR